MSDEQLAHLRALNLTVAKHPSAEKVFFLNAEASPSPAPLLMVTGRSLDIRPVAQLLAAAPDLLAACEELVIAAQAYVTAHEKGELTRQAAFDLGSAIMSTGTAAMKARRSPEEL